MKELIGRFHPVLVHLPIGILLLAALFLFLSRQKKYQTLQEAAGIALFWGMICAVLSCITGFLLSRSGDYDEQLVSTHQWFGIGTAVISLLAYWLFIKRNILLKWAMGLMVLLLIITGHLGGSLTHGAGYLTKGFSTGVATTVKRKPIPNVQEAIIYHDVVKPILQNNCYSCHGANKQKGKLRLDEQPHILKGGKDGLALVAGKADESEMIKRILLPLENEDHMPPKEKPQPSKQDIALLQWWINSGAPFDKKVKDIPQDEKTKPLLALLQTGEIKEAAAMADVPAAIVKKANDSVVQQLKNAGVMIVPVAQNSNYLSANFITANFTSKEITLLEKIKEQLVWLKLGHTKISDGDMIGIGKLSLLTRLFLNNTGVSDTGIKELKNLTNLQYLNLAATNVSSKGLESLRQLKKVQQLFLYKTQVQGNELPALQKIFSAAVIDTGNYVVPVLTSDTTLVKPAR